MGGQVKLAQRRLALDTDVVTFWLSLCGLLLFTGLAVRGFYEVVRLRTSALHATWLDYFGFMFVLWMFISAKGHPKIIRAMRFLLGLLLVLLGIPIVVSLMNLSRETARALSLWSHLTSALLYSAVVLFLIVWFRNRFRDAQLRSDSDTESMREQV